MRFILSNGKIINSKGFRVNIDGIRMERFAANPVMLKEHNPEWLIGRWENWKKEDNKLTADPVFDMEDPVAKEVSRKVKANFIRCASVWLRPILLEYINGEYILSESELIEASIVTIPSDEGAVRLCNEDRELLDFEKVKLNFSISSNSKEKEKMETENLKLSVATIERLGLSPGFTSRDVEIAVSEKDREIVQLKADLASRDKQIQDDYLAGAVKSGKITEAERLSYVPLCDKGCFKEVKAMIDAKPERASASLASMTQNTRLSAGREDWTYMDWMKKDPQGLGKLRVENAAEFERLQLTIKK